MTTREYYNKNLVMMFKEANNEGEEVLYMEAHGLILMVHGGK